MQSLTFPASLARKSHPRGASTHASPAFLQSARDPPQPRAFSAGARSAFAPGRQKRPPHPAVPIGGVGDKLPPLWWENSEVHAGSQGSPLGSVLRCPQWHSAHQQAPNPPRVSFTSHLPFPLVPPGATSQLNTCTHLPSSGSASDGARPKTRRMAQEG